MIVDDDLLLVKINETRLENLGYKVTALSDSRKALELFKNEPESFSLLITDQTMPGLTGAELCFLHNRNPQSCNQEFPTIAK